MHSVKVSGYDVFFPYEPYSIQKAYMARLLDCLKNTRNGLLESPTGTGKTLSILCSAMAWMDAENEKLIDNSSSQQEDVPLPNQEQPENRVRVIYASRTHVQLSQAMKELKNSYYSTKSAIILGSRDQLCVNQDVVRLDGNAAKTHACRTKTRTGACQFYDGYESKVLEQFESLEVVDIEDLVHKGITKKFCPYFASRLLKQKADVIFSPYNYLLDPTLRRNQGIDLKNTVVIFDEGHNIESNCEDCASSELRSLSLEVCVKEIDNQLNKSNNPVAEYRPGDVITSDAPKGSVAQSPENEMVDLSSVDLIHVKELLNKLKRLIEKQLEISKNSPNNRVPIDWFFDLLKSELRLNRDAVDQFLNVLDKMSLALGGTASHAANRLKIASFDSVSTFLRAIFPAELNTAKLKDYHEEFREKFAITLEEESGNFRRFQEKRDTYTTVSEAEGKVWSMHLYCLSPSVAMSQLMKLGVKCVIITSGTLSPLDSFESEMEIPFPVKLENRHVIEDKQVVVYAVGDRNGIPFDSRYANRNNNDYFVSLGESLIDYCRIIPDGLLVFFSSYAVLRKATEMWSARGQMDRLGTRKLVFIEPQDKTSFAECLDKFKAQIDENSSHGAIFFGVCRGKLSEGLDIGNRYCRSVVVIGVPFPSFNDNKGVLKREYVEKKRDPKFTASIYYNIQMKRSLNQAIGRVIRHKHDFGAVLLLDFRFSSHESSLSKWLRPYFKVASYPDSKKQLAEFFEQNRELNSPCQIEPVKISVKINPKLSTPFVSPFTGNTTNCCKTTNSSNYFRDGERNGEKKKPENFFSIFSNQMGQKASTTLSSIGPEKRKINARSNPYSRSPKQSPVSSAKSSDTTTTMADFLQRHGNDLKTHLREGNKLVSLTSALKDYQKANDVHSLVSKVKDAFSAVDVDQKKNFLSGISSIIKQSDRKQFRSLCGLGP